MPLTIHIVGEFYKHKIMLIHIFYLQRQINTPTILHINKKAQKQSKYQHTRLPRNTKLNKEYFTAHIFQENEVEADI